MLLLSWPSPLRGRKIMDTRTTKQLQTSRSLRLIVHSLLFFASSLQVTFINARLQNPFSWNHADMLWSQHVSLCVSMVSCHGTSCTERRHFETIWTLVSFNSFRYHLLYIHGLHNDWIPHLQGTPGTKRLIRVHTLFTFHCINNFVHCANLLSDMHLLIIRLKLPLSCHLMPLNFAVGSTSQPSEVSRAMLSLKQAGQQSWTSSDFHWTWLWLSFFCRRISCPTWKVSMLVLFYRYWVLA